MHTMHGALGRFALAPKTCAGGGAPNRCRPGGEARCARPDDLEALVRADAAASSRIHPAHFAVFLEPQARLDRPKLRLVGVEPRELVYDDDHQLQPLVKE
jgi:hypothetical protein